VSCSAECNILRDKAFFSFQTGKFLYTVNALNFMIRLLTRYNIICNENYTFSSFPQMPLPQGNLMQIHALLSIALETASELYRPSDRFLSANLVPTFADRGCGVISVTDPYGRILVFLDRSRYFFFQVAPHLYSGD
jgi:hypothetical protein